jgi:hypothetical protein
MGLHTMREEKAGEILSSGLSCLLKFPSLCSIGGRFPETGPVEGDESGSLCCKPRRRPAAEAGEA